MRLLRARRGNWSDLIFFLIRPALVLALLIPIITLFWMTWQANQGNSESATFERHGVNYVDALISLELSLAESQTATMTGQAVPAEQLAQSVEGVADVDEQYGDELRTHERWSELRAKIEALPSWNDNATAAYTASEETADLLLALIDKVRMSSGLTRDPDADTYYLQDAVAQELPEAIVASSRLVGLSLLTSTQSNNDQSASLNELLSARSMLTSNIDDLADDVRETVDTTESKTLGGSLLTPLDAFRQAVDALIPAATAMDGYALAIDSAQVIGSWGEAQTAVTTLVTAMLGEADGLLEDRIDSLRSEAISTLAALVTAVLLAVIPTSVQLRSECRRRRQPASSPEQSSSELVVGDLSPEPMRSDSLMIAVRERSGAAR